MTLRPFLILALLLLAGCGETEKISARPEISYADIQPASGMTYQEFRQHETWGQGDMRDAHKRFLMLDRDNNGRLTQDEIGN